MFLRPSHMLIDRLTKLATNHPDGEDGCASNRPDSTSSRQTEANLATLVLHRSLFLENIDIIRDIARDCVKIYSHIDESQPRFFEESRTKPHITAYLEKLLDKDRPTRTFIRTTFRQLIGFLSSQNRGAFSENINYLLSFINELRVAQSTSIHHDKKLIKLTPDVFHSISKDATLFPYWACVEVARYCVKESNITKDINVNEFLTLLDCELSNPGKFGEKYLRQFLVIFIQSLEKALDHDLETSLRRSSFVSSESSRIHLPYNQVLQNWIESNRKKMAVFSSKVNLPAECWRNVDIKLSDHLRIQTKSLNISGAEVPLESSLSRSDLEGYLALMTEAALQLDDLDLLHGIKSLANNGGLICDFPPLGAMISNMGGHFEKTYTDLSGKCPDLDEQSLNEFLKACVELSALKQNRKSIDLLQSGWLKGSYKRLIDLAGDNQNPLEDRLEEARKWLSSWSESESPHNIDLMMSAYMNQVSKPPQELLPASHDDAEWLLSEEYIAQTLFSPSKVNPNFKIHSVLFGMLELNDDDKHLPTDLVDIQSKNPRWNGALFRHICDLNWLDLLRRQGDDIDFVQYRAVKYHHRCDNHSTALKLSRDLLSGGSSSKAKIQCSLLLASDPQLNPERFRDLLDQIELSQMDELEKNDLRSKVFRKLIRNSRRSADTLVLSASSEDDKLKLNTTGELATINWEDVLDSSSDLSKIKNLSLISDFCHERYESSKRTDLTISSIFKLDLELLKKLNQFKSTKNNSLAVRCAVRILLCINVHHSDLSQNAVDSFDCEQFQIQTILTWILVKTNLISMVSSGLPAAWRNSIVKLLKLIVCEHPNVLLYRIIVNHFESKFDGRFSSPMLMDARFDKWLEDVAKSKPTSSIESQNDIELDLWQELYTCLRIKTNNGCDDWLLTIQETEGFVRELRRISFLCGENLYALSSSVSRRLARSLECLRQESVSGKGQLAGCVARLMSTCRNAYKQIDNLLLFMRGPNLDTYVSRFKDSDQLFRLHNQFETLKAELSTLSAQCAPAESYLYLQPVIQSINCMFAKLQRSLNSHSNQLWMNLISPKLSRLQPSRIPMPGRVNDTCNYGGQIVTIHKVSQTVEMIASKTNPKRLTLVGSDGVARSFLLKAHEDSRLDQYIMELFDFINELLSGQKETQNICRLRGYSVTPISGKSGLIEWVNAKPLSSIYRDWLRSSSGRSVVEDLYSSTCRAVCGIAEVGAPKLDHTNCQIAHDNVQLLDIYYQILWSKAKQTDNRSKLVEQKPSRETIHRYRAKFGPSLFQAVLEQLSHKLPNDLISRSLWRQSVNSYSFWTKTKLFTQSCATISMVGYMIGLGDRHLGNILLDYDTGEVVHIDFNICFELAKRMHVPEQVPFRLTDNIIRGFGFAGLEGGFTRTSRKVLNLLKQSKSTILYLLEPKNWDFMIATRGSSETIALDLPVAAVGKVTALSSYPAAPVSCAHLEQHDDDPFSMADPLVAAPKAQPEPELFAGAPMSMSGTVRRFEAIRIDSQEKAKPEVVHELGSIDHSENGSPFLNDLQQNIETPIKVLEETATKMFQRVGDKLSGADAQLGPIMADRPSLSSNCSREEMFADDLTLPGGSQSTNDQVEALILEATSLKNKAAMYEGWMSWV